MSTEIEMPRYQSHKQVWALKISEVRPSIYAGHVSLVFEDKAFSPLRVTEEWALAKKPEAGGYYVVYPGDGYASYSPAKAFEEGHSAVSDIASPAAHPATDCRACKGTGDDGDCGPDGTPVRVPCPACNGSGRAVGGAAELTRTQALRIALEAFGFPDEQVVYAGTIRNSLREAFEASRPEAQAAPSDEKLDEAAAYRLWRDCEIREDAWFMQHLSDYLPRESFNRAPTAAEFDAAMMRVMSDRAALAATPATQQEADK